MTMTSLVFWLTLVAQGPGRPVAAVARTAAPAPAAAPSTRTAPLTACTSPPSTRTSPPSTRTAEERAALIAKRQANRQRRAQAEAQRQADEARQEAALRDEEIKKAPVVADRIQMARLQQQEQQRAITNQALANMQQMQSAQLANQQYAIGLQYWLGQQPVRVIVTPIASQQP